MFSNDGVIPALAVGAVVLMAILGVGRVFEPWLPETFGRSDRWAFRFLFGAGVVGTSVWVVGQLSYGVVPIGIACGLGLLSWFARGTPRWLPVDPQSDAFGARPHSRWPIWAVAATLSLLTIGALAQPAGSIEHDGIAYHLLGPKVWLRDGFIRPVLDHACTAYPAIWESLFGMAMALGSTRGAALIGVAAAMGLLACAHGLALRLGASQRTAMVAAALVATMPVSVGLADQWFVDSAFAAIALLSARLLFEAAGNWRVLALGGAGLGFALGTKYTGLPLAAVTCTVLMAMRWREARWGRAMAEASVVGGVALTIGGAWYLRNALLLGNPVYPHYFGGVGFPEESVPALAAYLRQRGAGLGSGAVDLLLLPWRFTLQTASYHGAGGIGLGPLALAPIGIWSLWQTERLRIWVAWAALLAIAWFVIQQEARFLIHAVVVAAVLAGVGGHALSESSRLGRVLTQCVLGISVLYGLAFLVRAREREIGAFFSPTRAAERVTALTPFLGAFEYLNATDEVRRVAVLHEEVATFFLDKPYVKIRGPYGEYPIEGVRNSADLMSRLGALGITHILDVSTARSGFRAVADSRLTIVYADSMSQVYKAAAETDP